MHLYFMNMNTKNRQRHTEESFTFALERSLLYAKRAKKNKWISLLKQTIQTKGEEWEITWAVLWWYFQNYGCAFWKRMCFFSDHAFCTNMVVVSSESEGWFCLLLYSFQNKRWEWAILAFDWNHNMLHWLTFGVTFWSLNFIWCNIVVFSHAILLQTTPGRASSKNDCHHHHNVFPFQLILYIIRQQNIK
jgi:hypothetical protein